MKIARGIFPLGVLLGIGALTGCGNMELQANRRALTPSDISANGASARLPPAHTVAWRGEMTPGAKVQPAAIDQENIPPRVTEGLLHRGQGRYEIYCAMCHGADGYGRGIVVRRGFPAPPSLHEDRLRAAAADHFYEVITRGYGTMLPLGAAIAPADRWAIAAYIAALQRSQHATAQDLASPLPASTSVSP